MVTISYTVAYWSKSLTVQPSVVLYILKQHKILDLCKSAQWNKVRLCKFPASKLDLYPHPLNTTGTGDSSVRFDIYQLINPIVVWVYPCIWG